MEWSRRRRDSRRRTFIRSYAFPPALRDKLHEQLGDDHHAAVALEGLREWYLACLSARGETLGMPSRVVDIAWHEMILMTRTYHHFCENAFGHYLHHSPEAVMDEPIDDGLARTLKVLEAQSSGTIAGVPLLFAVDSELGREDGYAWRADQIDQLRRRELDLDGHRHSASCAAVGGGCGGGGGGGGGCVGGGCGGGGCGGGG